MNPELLRLSEVTLKGQTIRKLDLIATISIDHTPFLTVYRRYNNVHEIIVVDCQDDIYLQRDLPFLESIRRVLCLTPEQTSHVRIADLFSFQHQGTPPTGHPSPLEMYWSDIQAHWQGIVVDLVDVWEASTNSLITIPTSIPSDENLVHLLTDIQHDKGNRITRSVSKKRTWSQRKADSSHRSKRRE